MSSSNPLSRGLQPAASSRLLNEEEDPLLLLLEEEEYEPPRSLASVLSLRLISSGKYGQVVFLVSRVEPPPPPDKTSRYAQGLSGIRADRGRRLGCAARVYLLHTSCRARSFQLREDDNEPMGSIGIVS